MSLETETGTVKWFDDRKGFGFIARDGGRGDVFVHHSAIREQPGFRSLTEGDEVRFVVGEGRKGLEAKEVVRLN